jgi:serine/threonine protein kinase
MAERQFGPYRLVRQIAVGGMAEIHLAKTRGIAGFEKYVALKMIHPNFAQDDQFIQMLIDEAKIAVQLQHVNVAQTFDLGRVGDTYYITMEFVDGADLYKILRKGSEQDQDMPLDVCAFIAKETATGLDYAHRKKDVAGKSLGIVHRDMSPQNVLVSNAGEVKIVDFGIAKATMKVRQTAVGVIKGKYYYMSPEQAWGDPLDHRSDIFSAGIVLYEMITGQMLYLEEDLHKLLDMVRRANIAPPSSLRQGVPPQLERIVMHALAKNANDRYQSAGDMASDLERFLHTYSPVFTASKLSRHLREVLGDPVIAPAPAPVPEKRNPNLSTQPIDRGELVRDHSEFTDENSVIFRVAELKARDAPRPLAPRPSDYDDSAPTADEGPRVQTTRPIARPPTAQPIPRRAPTQPPPVMKIPPITPRAPAPRPAPMQPTAPIRKQARIDEPTMQVGEHELHDIEEMTAVSTSPPGGLADLGDYEPTMIDAPPTDPSQHDDDAATTTREPHAPLGGSQADSSAATTSPLARGASDDESVPRGPVSEARGRLRPGSMGAPAHPALSAKNPTPAVSELKRPKASRRTPAQGVPHAAGPASVLQAIVSAQNSEPMPTRQMRGIGGPSDGVPPSPLADPVSSGAMTNPDAGRGAIPPQAAQPPWPPQPPSVPPGMPPIPGANILPQPPIYQQGPQAALPHNQLPPHLQPYAMHEAPPPQQGQGMPLGAPVQTPYPFLPYPSQPPTFTKQLTALEADEIPPHLRLDANRPNWILRGLLAVVLIGGIGAMATLLVKSQEDQIAKASLYIDSVPPGATVSVDGKQLPNPTPVAFNGTQAGARHVVELRMKGKKTWTETIVVPAAGGEVQVKPFLQALTVTLHVTSTPPGAEVYFGDDDQPQGRTPFDKSDLVPGAVKKVTLKLAGYAPDSEPVDFGDQPETTVAATLHK